jgi:glycosyltransferase involved in cell wall biosynthesis
MRILYLHPRAWSGEYPILKALRQSGHEVCVLEEWRGPRREARFLTSDFLDAGDGIATLWYDPHQGWEKTLTWPADRLFKRAFSGRNLAHRMWLIRAAVKHFRPDVVACTDGFTYALPAAYLKRLGLIKPRLVVSYIGGDILDCPEVGVGRRRTPLVNWLIRTSLPGIDALRPLCDSLARILIRDGAEPSRLHVLPIQLGRPLAELGAIRAARGAHAERLRAAYGIAGDAPLVVTISGNHKGKGLHLLAQEWPRIRAALPGARWLLCGPEESWLDRGVRPLLKAAGLLETVVFTGALSGAAVYEHLAAADIHANPTLCEGLNMVTVEAAAVGTPTVTSDGAGVADWLARFDAGAVVPAYDAPALGDAIIRALLDPGLRARWQAGCQAMVEEFSLDRIAAALERLMAPPADE